MIAEFIHGTVHFVIRNKATGKTETLRRNHNWYAKGKDWKTVKTKEEKRFKKEWNDRGGDYNCFSVGLKYISAISKIIKGICH